MIASCSLQFIRTLVLRIIVIQILVGKDPPPEDDNHERNATQRKA